MKTAKKKSNVRSVPFCKVELNCSFNRDGVEYHKFAPRYGMTQSGQVVSFKDSDLVRVG